MHVDNVKDILQKPNASIVLIELLSGKKKMTELQEKVKNYASLKLLVLELEKKGYVKIEGSTEGKRVIYVSLTKKGRIVAEALKKAQWLANLPLEKIERFAQMKAFIHINTYEDHITLKEIHLGESHIIDVFVRLKGDVLYLYCDYDKTDDCEHIEVIFADLELSDYLREWLKKNGYKLAKKYQKYVDKYW